MKRITSTFILLIATLQLFAQGQGNVVTDSLYSSGKIYVVVSCVLIILLGLLFFLYTIEKRIKKLERKSSGKN